MQRAQKGQIRLSALPICGCDEDEASAKSLFYLRPPFRRKRRIAKPGDLRFILLMEIRSKAFQLGSLTDVFCQTGRFPV